MFINIYLRKNFVSFNIWQLKDKIFHNTYKFTYKHFWRARACVFRIIINKKLLQSCRIINIEWKQRIFKQCAFGVRNFKLPPFFSHRQRWWTISTNFFYMSSSKKTHSTCVCVRLLYTMVCVHSWFSTMWQSSFICVKNKYISFLPPICNTAVGMVCVWTFLNWVN